MGMSQSPVLRMNSQTINKTILSLVLTYPFLLYSVLIQDRMTTVTINNHE